MKDIYYRLIYTYPKAIILKNDPSKYNCQSLNSTFEKIRDGNGNFLSH